MKFMTATVSAIALTVATGAAIADTVTILAPHSANCARLPLPASPAILLVNFKNTIKRPIGYPEMGETFATRPPMSP